MSESEHITSQGIYDKVQNARLVSLTSVVIAVAINIIAVYATNYPYATAMPLFFS